MDKWLPNAVNYTEIFYMYLQCSGNDNVYRWVFLAGIYPVWLLYSTCSPVLHCGCNSLLLNVCLHQDNGPCHIFPIICDFVLALRGVLKAPLHMEPNRTDC